jgi:hypothetical protein
MRTKKLPENTVLLRVTGPAFPLGHDKLKSPYHTNKIFTPKFRAA